MAASWTVTGDQGGQFDWDGGGQPVQGHVISFKTGADNTGTVFIPDKVYATPAHGRQLIQAAANIADEYGAMHS